MRLTYILLELIIYSSAQATYGLASDSRFGFQPGENMYAEKAYIGNHREGNDAVSNTITKHLNYGLGDFDFPIPNNFGIQGYVLDDDGNYPEGMF